MEDGSVQDEGQLRVDGGALAVRWNVFRSVSRGPSLNTVSSAKSGVVGAESMTARSGVQVGCWSGSGDVIGWRGWLRWCGGVGGGKAAAARWTVGFGLIPGVCVCVCVCVVGTGGGEGFPVS